MNQYRYTICGVVIIPLLFVMAVSSCTNGSTASMHIPAATPAPKMEWIRAEKAPLSQLVKLPAQLAAYEQVSIFPKVNGYVRQVWVDIGSHVKKGQLLMELEAPELEQAAMQGKERYARARLDYTISKENYDRLLQASQTDGAVAPMGLASAKAKADADSTLSNAEKANWQMQQTILGYLKVTAPFEGVISERNVHPGALVSAEGKDNKPMLDLRQTSRLRLQVDIPEGIAANLEDKDTVTFYCSAFPGKKMTGHIVRRSGVVNSQFRSERVELDVDNKDGHLSPGMYADVLFYSKGNPAAFSVPRSAVVTSTDRKYVIALRDGKTVRIDVATGNESADKVEVTGDLRTGEELVAHANDEVKEGLSIK